MNLVCDSVSGFLYYQDAPDDCCNAYLGAGGYGVRAGAACVQFLYTAIETDLYLAHAVSGYAHVYLTDFTDGIVDVEGSVALQFPHLAKQCQEYGYERASHKYADDAQQELVVYGAVEADSAPSEAQHEIYYVSDAEKMHGSAMVEGIASAVSVEADIDVAGVSGITETYETEGHLDNEYYAGENSDYPVHLHNGCLGLKIGVKFLYHTAFDFVVDKDI